MWRLLFVFGAVATPPLADCHLLLQNGRFEGSCGRAFGGTPTFTLTVADSITTGVWRTDLKPTSVWRGDMILSAPQPGSPIEVEVYEGGTGILRNAGGWFLLSAFTRSSDTLAFQLDPSQRAAPSSVDRQIIQRAVRLLSSEAQWDRADDRVCAANDTTWSIYCAMERATIDVAGAFHHRRPALELVRLLVEERTAGRSYEHRLMDYNNDKTTRLDDVQALFRDALAKFKP